MHRLIVQPSISLLTTTIALSPAFRAHCKRTRGRAVDFECAEVETAREGVRARTAELGRVSKAGSEYGQVRPPVPTRAHVRAEVPPYWSAVYEDGDPLGKYLKPVAIRPPLLTLADWYRPISMSPQG